MVWFSFDAIQNDVMAIYIPYKQCVLVAIPAHVRERSLHSIKR